MIDDPDIEQAVERVAGELAALREVMLELREHVSAIRVVLEALLEEAHSTNVQINRLRRLS